MVRVDTETDTRAELIDYIIISHLVLTLAKHWQKLVCNTRRAPSALGPQFHGYTISIIHIQL
jgi:hypothetical protein